MQHLPENPRAIPHSLVQAINTLVKVQEPKQPLRPLFDEASLVRILEGLVPVGHSKALLLGPALYEELQVLAFGSASPTLCI